MRTEVPFTLPMGYVDGNGNVHREGRMRLATARDEIEPLGDAGVRQNQAYLSVLLVARTVTQIGEITEITPELVEGLYAGDFDHLQRLYERINSNGDSVGVVTLPQLLTRVRGGYDRDRGRWPGGMRGPSRDQLLSETARLAYHFHWPLDTILDLEHADRYRFLAEAESLSVGSDETSGG